MDLLLDPVGMLILGHVEIITALQVHPELRRRAEVARQPDCRIREKLATTKGFPDFETCFRAYHETRMPKKEV